MGEMNVTAVERREVVDAFLEGKTVDPKELREAIRRLCVSLSEARAAARRREIPRRSRIPPP